jgi:hypothetical protein
MDAMRCRKCGEAVRLGQRFCEACGTQVEHAAWLAKQQGTIALEWRAATAVARLLEQSGDPEKARQQLGAICGAAEGLDSAELDDARRLLQSLR